MSDKKGREKIGVRRCYVIPPELLAIAKKAGWGNESEGIRQALRLLERQMSSSDTQRQHDRSRALLA